MFVLQVMNWLHSHKQPVYDDLTRQYQVTAQTTYQKILRDFFDDKRSTVTRKSAEKLFSKFGSKKSELALSQKMASSSNIASRHSLASRSRASLASRESLDSIQSEPDFAIGTQGNQFESSVRDALDFVEITMSKEETFINTFFGETRGAAARSAMIEEVLSRFSAELESFINTSCKFDPYYALPIYLSLGDRMEDVSGESFVFSSLQQCLGTATAYFDKLQLVSSI